MDIRRISSGYPWANREIQDGRRDGYHCPPRYKFVTAWHIITNETTFSAEISMRNRFWSYIDLQINILTYGVDRCPKYAQCMLNLHFPGLLQLFLPFSVFSLSINQPTSPLFETIRNCIHFLLTILNISLCSMSRFSKVGFVRLFSVAHYQYNLTRSKC